MRHREKDSCVGSRFKSTGAAGGLAEDAAAGRDTTRGHVGWCVCECTVLGEEGDGMELI